MPASRTRSCKHTLRFRPPVVWPDASSGAVSVQAALDSALWLPKHGRGFDGVLSGMRTPLGLATARSEAKTGLTIWLA